MNFLTWGRNPWDQPILTHISWDLLWASLFAGVVFLVAHASYMVFSAHRKRHADETDAMEAARADLPGRIVRHSLVARMFHWVMAAAMFTLLLTAFGWFYERGRRIVGVSTDSRTGALGLYENVGMTVVRQYTRYTKRLAGVPSRSD